MVLKLKPKLKWAVHFLYMGLGPVQDKVRRSTTTKYTVFVLRMMWHSGEPRRHIVAGIGGGTLLLIRWDATVKKLKRWDRKW